MWNPHNVLRQLFSERLLPQLKLQPRARHSFMSPYHFPIPYYCNSEKLTTEILHREWEELLCQHPSKNQHKKITLAQKITNPNQCHSNRNEEFVSFS